jgi:hypothetical protein
MKYNSVSILFLIVLLSCNQNISPKKDAETLGQWGGKGVQLEVSENNSFFDFDCASASIASKLKTSGYEVVEQYGTYTYEHGGPILIDEKPDIHPAAFRGTIEGDSMKLAITILDQKRPDIPLKLKRNVVGLVYKCL